MSVLVIRQLRHRSHTEGPLLHYQTKPTFDPEVPRVPRGTQVPRGSSHTEGPLLHYQTKLTFDPGVAVMGHMRAKANIKFLQPSTQMPNWLSFVESGSVKTYGWFVFTEHKSQSDCNMKAGAGFLWEPGLWYLALSAAL